MFPSVCAEGMCARKSYKGSVFCRAHQRLKSRAYLTGTRVVFAPFPASHLLYSRAPHYGAAGSVVKVPLGGRSATFLFGPGGGLLYVRWDGDLRRRAFTMGVSPWDLYRAPSFDIGDCEFCEARNVPLVAVLKADPAQRVCAECHADARIPTEAR